MALSEIYVDPSLAGDTGRGTRATITLAAATFTTGTWNLAEVGAFSGYTFVSGDEIYISGGTNVNTGLYTIVSKTDDDNIVLSGDITSDVSSPTDVTSDSAPFGDLEYGIEQTTFDTTNGTRVNILAGTDEIVAVELSAAMASAAPTAAWVPSIAAPCIFQGYTATAGDGGKGGISGGGTVSVYNDTGLNYVHFMDLHCHNTGSNGVLNFNDQCSVVNCEINNATGNGIEVDTGALISQNNVHDIQGVGIISGSIGNLITGNFLKDGTKKFTQAITLSLGSVAINNIISLSGTGNGIGSVAYTSVINNSIFSSGTGPAGISLAASQSATSITNNMVEGFTIGYDLDGSGTSIRQYGGNAAYNNGTEYTAIGAYVLENLGDNETLTASPFTDAANDDFSPVNIGNVKEGSLPQTFGDGAI